MRSDNRQAPTTPSVLDRLLDDNPKESTESQAAMVFDLRRFKQAVARDLQALLNTRRIDLEEEIERYPYARNSMINFGIIDLSSLSLLNPNDRALLRDKIRIAIEPHEPRLTKVKVTLDAPRELERMLRFRVDAVLKVHPNKPPVIFDALLQLSSNAYQINEQ
jgi:type VI secretion system protein ImpF